MGRNGVLLVPITQAVGNWVGPERSRVVYAWRSLLGAGIPVACGGDCPVEPPDPMLGVYAGVTRCDGRYNPPGGWHPEQRLTVEEAVRGFTLGSAYAVGEKGVKGTLEPGKLADLAVWEPDPLEVDPAGLKDVSCAMTVVGGDVIWRRY